MVWRPHLPENCPPDDAQSTNKVVYRLIRGTTPKDSDFLSYKEEGRAYSDEDECKASGVSVYTDIEGIRSLKRKIKSLKNRKVISGILKPNDGVAKNTPSNIHPSHLTWWLPEDLNPIVLFNVITEET